MIEAVGQGEQGPNQTASQDHISGGSRLVPRLLALSHRLSAQDLDVTNSKPQCPMRTVRLFAAGLTNVWRAGPYNSTPRRLDVVRLTHPRGEPFATQQCAFGVSAFQSRG